jgi:hypothetical protein
MAAGRSERIVAESPGPPVMPTVEEVLARSYRKVKVLVRVLPLGFEIHRSLCRHVSAKQSYCGPIHLERPISLSVT